MRIGAVVIFSLFVAIPAQAELKLSLGADYSSGDYGTNTTTRVLYLPLSLDYRADKFGLGVTVPYLGISNIGSGTGVTGGPSNVFVRRAAQLASMQNEAGLGDITAYFSYGLWRRPEDGLYLDGKAKIKIGTADEVRGLGTGENDYSLELDLAKIFDPITVFGSVGYTIMGDPPGLDLRNTIYGSIGGDYRFTEKLSGGLSFDFRESTAPGASAQSTVMVYLAPRWSENVGYQLYLRKGLTTNSEDFGGGASISFKLK